jgi:phage terminase large subunit-like protein
LPHSHCDVARQYAEDVLSGKLIACKWVKLACERELRDLERQHESAWAYRFDERKANHVCAFIECLPHIKGSKWAGTPIHLEPWQCFILTTVFGWVQKDSGLRRFKTSYCEVPRKNAKSTLSSGVGIYMLTADGEAGADVYSAATTRDQARIVFADSQAMARKTPELREYYGLAVNAHNMNVLETSSKFEALSAEANTLDGLNIHCAIVDELHAHKTRMVWEVIETATGSRSQPLIWAITTAGFNRAGICYEQRGYVTRLLEHVAQDESYFGIIYTIDDGDPWDSEDSWRKANPNFGISVNPEDLARKATKALQVPSAVAGFLTKHLDVWISSEAGLFDMLAWDKCAKPNLKPEQFTDCPCWVAMDLGFVDDIAAVVKMFVRDVQKEDGSVVPTYYFFGRYYLPEETIEESRNSQYSGWRRMDRITATDGNVTDIEVIVDDLAQDLARYNVQQIAFDPYNKLTLLNAMQRRGVSQEKLVEYPQTVAMMSPATEALMKAIRAENVGHNGCPVMSWALSNVIGHFDNKDNVYPKKERPENKIDPAIAAIMALGRSLLNDGPGESIYSTRGLLAA